MSPSSSLEEKVTQGVTVPLEEQRPEENPEHGAALRLTAFMGELEAKDTGWAWKCFELFVMPVSRPSPSLQALGGGASP